MANCNSHFQTFNGNITLTEARRKSLKTSRKELRNKIRNDFKENHKYEIQPKFSGQGSLFMDTIINPIPRKTIIEGEEKTLLYYDVDDGVYFEGDDEVANRHSIATYHRWILDAVNGHTETPAIDKNTCVRTVFADGHNIDNPIYYKKGSVPELAHKRDGWIESDPKAFSEWFIEKAEIHPQLRRIVRCLKAWTDKRDFDNASKAMPSGMILTILASNNFSPSNDRDDISLKETLVNIEAKLKKNFVCERPTTPKGENLLANYSAKDYFMDCLTKLISDAKLALAEKNEKKSTELWRKHLSDRFPLGEDKDVATNASAGISSLITPTTKPYSA